ncbi:peptidase inhibitor family I36 protein [Nonomuraea sp. NPDC050643]|uniref:peptidase inhibitor family I36 protein n=1 Tax=Nonomuraea sp. NPDC050643 TaxID=3155660 RepID=UPI0033DB5D8F
MRKILITFAAMTFAVLGLAAPSSAAGSAGGAGLLAFGDCPSGYGCFWTGTNGGGSRWDAPHCSVGGFPFNLSGHWLDNNIESVRNRGGGTIHLYSDYYGNDYMTSIVNNGQGVNLHSHHRNQASSIRIDC